MSKEKNIFFTKSKPYRHKSIEKQLSHPNSVRVYRSSPESVALQLRRDTEYCHVELSFKEAQQIAAALLEEC